MNVWVVTAYLDGCSPGEVCGVYSSEVRALRVVRQMNNSEERDRRGKYYSATKFEMDAKGKPEGKPV